MITKKINSYSNLKTVVKKRKLQKQKNLPKKKSIKKSIQKKEEKKIKLSKKKSTYSACNNSPGFFIGTSKLIFKNWG